MPVAERRLRCAPPGSVATEIVIGCDVRVALPRLLDGLGRHREPSVFVDRAVGELHRQRLAGLPAAYPIAGGETAKSFARLEEVTRHLARSGAQPDGVVVAVGGGSIGDLCGLAAALFARGLTLVHVPTTLLSMVDSSIGGKTAIDLPEGKNLVGAFHQPAAVLCDLEFLATLPAAELRSGLGEVLKVAIGLDAGLFAQLEEHGEAVLQGDPEQLAGVIAAAAAAKAAVVERDFRDGGERRLLNLGHTLGHALEAFHGGEIPHGVAVARGIHHAVGLAERHGHLAAADAARIRRLLAGFGFEPTPLPPWSKLEPFLGRDKKRRQGRQVWVLPTGIGRSTVAVLPA